MNSGKTDFDAIVVGSGPNGFVAGITLLKEGKSVLLLERNATVGGGMRTAELTLPGFKHDVCSAVHPMAVASPFFNSVDWSAYGLDLIHPPVCAAHPLDNGSPAVLYNSFTQTAEGLGADQAAYERFLRVTVNNFHSLKKDLLGPLSWPTSPLPFIAFGVKALQPASWTVKQFQTQEAKALFAGMAAHGIQPLSNWAGSAIAMVLMAAGHVYGWPIPGGGSQSIADAMAAHFRLLGGVIETNVEVKSLQQLPASKAVLFDCTPKQLLQIAGHKFSDFYKWQLNRYRYGMGVFKIDWALDAPIPWKDEKPNWLEPCISETRMRKSAGMRLQRQEVFILKNPLYYWRSLRFLIIHGHRKVNIRPGPIAMFHLVLRKI